MAVERNPANLTALFHVGLLMYPLGRMEEAEAAYKRVLSVRDDGSMYEVRCNLGMMQAMMGKHEQAVVSGMGMNGVGVSGVGDWVVCVGIDVLLLCCFVALLLCCFVARLHSIGRLRRRLFLRRLFFRRRRVVL
jgi:hypothetical protein